MSQTDGRLAPVTYLPGVVPPHAAEPPSVSSVPESGALDSAEGTTWNNSWGVDVGRAAVERPADDDACAQLSDAAEGRVVETAAERIAFGQLARRGLSQRELERALRDRDIDDETIEREMERLTRVGLVDDLAFAQTLVATLQERKGLGRSAIASELTRRLFSPAAIEYALELIDTGDEIARATEIARKRAGQLSSYDRATAERRLSAYLMRRGYSGSTVRAAVEQALPMRSTSTVRFR